MALNGESPYNTANTLKNRFNGRNSTMIRGLRNYAAFNLGSTAAQNVSLRSDTDGARIEVNGIDVPTGRFNGSLFQPATIKAIAPAGSVFQGWLSGGANMSTVFAKGPRWSYYDKGSLDGTSWTANDYSTTSWQTGTAPLGYGMTGVNTVVSYGSNSNSKYPTCYFRRTFRLQNAPSSNAVFELNYACDDGFVVYVNGTEATRYNMPSGNITFNTYSSTYASSEPFEGTIQLKGSLFNSGSNVICVEVHNTSGTSSDLYWDAELRGELSTGTASYYSTEAEISLPTGTVNLTASYRPMTAAERQQAGIHAVCINEVSAANSIYVNEYGKKNDWVELYNTTDEEQDIEGMYLTDNLQKLQKWQITRGETNAVTRIPAHGHLLVWCDGLLTTNQALHAPFKLSADGGAVALSAANMSWTDSLSYAAHDGNHTYGRYPDGGSDIYAMTVPTIEKTNHLSSYDELSDQSTLGIQQPTISSANGMRLSYVNASLLVKSEDANYARIQIFTPSGQLVETDVVNLHGMRGQLSVAHLQAGLYIARATDSEGNNVSCKFAIR